MAQQTFSEQDFLPGSSTPSSVQTKPKQTYSDSDFADTPSKVAARATPDAVKTIAQKVAPYVPTGAAIVGGAVAAGASGGLGIPGLYSGLLGSGTTAAITNLLQPKPKDESYGFAKDTAIDTAWNELAGRPIGWALKGAGIIGGGLLGSIAPSIADKFNVPGIDKSLLALKPTYAQLTGGRLSNLIENSFTAKLKAQALNTTSGLTKDAAKDLISKVAGRNLSLEGGEQLGEDLQESAINAYNSYKNVSNIRGKAVKSIAENGRNTQDIPIFQMQGNPQNLPAGQNQMPQMIATGGTYKVNGPIIPTNTINTIKGLQANIAKSHIKPGPNDVTMNKLNDIMNSIMIKDPSTGQTYYRPAWNFDEAWATKQHAGDLGYEGVKEADKTIDKVAMQKVSKAINEDIENSIQNSGLWYNQDIKAAINNYTESRSLSAQRYSLFGNQNQTGSSTKNLIKQQIKGTAVQSPINVLNSIIDDPVRLAQFLRGEKMPIDTATGTQYIFDNKRQDMAAYKIMRMFNDSFSSDSTNAANRVFDANKFNAQLNPNDANLQASNKLLFSQQTRSDLEQFAKNLAATQQKGDLGARPYWYLRAGATGFGLSAALLSGAAGNIPGAIGITGGTLTLNQIGKLLTNPSSARLMVNLANNSALSMSTQAAGRVIANVLKNQPIAIKYSDGNEVNMKYNNDGKLVLPLNQ